MTEFKLNDFFDCGKDTAKTCLNREDASPCPHYVDTNPWKCCYHCDEKNECADCCPIAKDN